MWKKLTILHLIIYGKESDQQKIKKRTNIGDIKRGGLKMLDFEIMDKALKIAWIKPD